MIKHIKKGITYAESKDAGLKVRAAVENMLNEVGEKAMLLSGNYVVQHFELKF